LIAKPEWPGTACDCRGSARAESKELAPKQDALRHTSHSRLRNTCSQDQWHIETRSVELFCTFPIMSVLQENYQRVADAYPDIARKIKCFWGNQEFTDLMVDLLTNTRDHQRVGFPLPVVASFIQLQQLHDQVFPKYAERSYAPKVLSHRPSGFGNL
jgi:hypothetical protein